MDSDWENTDFLEMNVWRRATWKEFLNCSGYSDWNRGKSYYFDKQMMLEMSPVGPLDRRQNSIMSYVVILFANLRNIPIFQFINTSFRKAAIHEFQPDLTYYIGSSLRVPPDDSDSLVNLHECDPPNLVVEIGSSSFKDDLGRKRLLYEQAGICEYWINNAYGREILAFAINNEGSRRIQQSLVLPGLEIAVVQEVLNQSRTKNDG